VTDSSDWTTSPLSQLADVVTERLDPSQAAGLPYVGLEHIAKDSGVLLGMGSPSDVKSTKTVFRAGDILYGKLRPYLNKVHLADTAGVCSTDILVLRPREGHSGKYVCYRLRTGDFIRYATSNSKGVNLPRISPKLVGDFITAVPTDLEGEERVVARVEELMSDVGAGDTEVAHAADAVGSFRMHVLRAALGPSRLECPDSWTSAHAGMNLAASGSRCPEVQLTHLFKWASGEGLPDKARRSGSVPVYGGNGISGWHDRAMTSDPAIVVGRVGYHCGNIHLTEGEAWITDNCIRSTWHDPDANLRFYAHWLESQRLNEQSAGTRQKYINQSALKGLVAPFPNPDTQLRVVAEIEQALSLVNHSASLLGETKERSAALRQSILLSAFSGQLV